MKKILLVNFLVIILALGFFYISTRGFSDKQEQTTTMITPSVSVEEYELQTDDQGAVVVEVTPIVLNRASGVKFNLTISTHSVELDFDIAKIVQLVDDQGNIYKALSWTGGSGVHHLTGILTFPELSEKSKSIRLTISQIDKTDRIFKWDL